MPLVKDYPFTWLYDPLNAKSSSHLMDKIRSSLNTYMYVKYLSKVKQK